MKIGMIGAGAISVLHMNAYAKIPGCEVTAIADLNLPLAQGVADKYGIANVYSDYRNILADESIDAVSIVTPTFTHKSMAIDAIKANKHVLCEKPPALNAHETREIAEAAKKYDKCFMFAFALRFENEVTYLKDYVDSGKMGKIVCAQGARLNTLSPAKGWFNSRAKGGGSLRDEGIHELDAMLYLMGYPKPKAVLAAADFSNKELLYRVKNCGKGWHSVDTTHYERDVEDVIKGFVTFENGASLIIGASSILRATCERRYVEINGDTAGAMWSVDKRQLEMNEINDEDMSVVYTPDINKNNPFDSEIAHFVDCCLGKAESICRVDEAVRLMEIIDAIYESADKGIPIML